MFVELLLNGLVEGSLLALIAIGYSLAYGSARVINFAHADIMIASGGYLVLLWISGTTAPFSARILLSIIFGCAAYFTALLLFSPTDGLPIKLFRIPVSIALAVGVLTYSFAGRIPFILSVILAIPWSAIFATAVYRIGYLPLLLKGAPRTSVLLAALGMSIAIESTLLIAWGSQQRGFPPEALPSSLVVRSPPESVSFWTSASDYGIVQLSSTIQMPVYDVLIILIFFVIAVLLFIFFRYSRTADAIIASADSMIAARACGIPVEKIFGYAFFLGGAIASLGGTLYIIRAKTIYPTAGFSPGILAFAACVVGGIGSLRGSIAGAFITSMLISFAPAIELERVALLIFPATWLRWLPSLNVSDWSYGVVYSLMILIILFKPQGLFQE